MKITSQSGKLSNEDADVIFINIDLFSEKKSAKCKGFPI